MAQLNTKQVYVRGRLSVWSCNTMYLRTHGTSHLIMISQPARPFYRDMMHHICTNDNNEDCNNSKDNNVLKFLKKAQKSLPRVITEHIWTLTSTLYCRIVPEYILCLAQVRLRAEVPCITSSARLGLELMTSRSWQYISCHWHTCYNH